MRNFCNCPYKRPVKRGPVKGSTQARIQEILFLMSLPGIPTADFVLLQRELVEGWLYEKA
jgi:hypothetical protein